MRNANIILFRKLERKRPFGRPGHRWKDNINMNLKEMWSKDVNLTHVAQDRDQLSDYQFPKQDLALYQNPQAIQW
jgi:hypothetical protein